MTPFRCRMGGATRPAAAARGLLGITSSRLPVMDANKNDAAPGDLSDYSQPYSASEAGLLDMIGGIPEGWGRTASGVAGVGLGLLTGNPLAAIGGWKAGTGVFDYFNGSDGDTGFDRGDGYDDGTGGNQGGGMTGGDRGYASGGRIPKPRKKPTRKVKAWAMDNAYDPALASLAEAYVRGQVPAPMAAKFARMRGAKPDRYGIPSPRKDPEGYAFGGALSLARPGSAVPLPGTLPSPMMARADMARSMARGQTVTPEMLRAAGGPASVADTASRITPAMQAILDRRAQTILGRGGVPRPAGFRGGGRIAGPGTGRSDSVPAVLNGIEPIDVSDGEYVIPADVVAAKGDGSTDAGARVLDAEVMATRRKWAKKLARVPAPRKGRGGKFLGGLFDSGDNKTEVKQELPDYLKDLSPAMVPAVLTALSQTPGSGTVAGFSPDQVAAFDAIRQLATQDPTGYFSQMGEAANLARGSAANTTAANSIARSALVTPGSIGRDSRADDAIRTLLSPDKYSQGAITSLMNPFDALVTNQALKSFDRDAAIQTAQSDRDRASRRAFGTRAQLAEAEEARGIGTRRDNLLASLNQAGFDKAVAQFNTNNATKQAGAQGALAGVGQEYDRLSGNQQNQLAIGQNRLGVANALGDLGSQGANTNLGIANFLAGNAGDTRATGVSNAQLPSGVGNAYQQQQQQLLDAPWSTVGKLNTVFGGAPMNTTQTGGAGSSPISQLAGLGLLGAAGIIGAGKFFRDGGRVPMPRGYKGGGCVKRRGYADGGVLEPAVVAAADELVGMVDAGRMTPAQARITYEHQTGRDLFADFPGRFQQGPAIPQPGSWDQGRIAAQDARRPGPVPGSVAMESDGSLPSGAARAEAMEPQGPARNPLPIMGRNLAGAAGQVGDWMRGLNEASRAPGWTPLDLLPGSSAAVPPPASPAASAAPPVPQPGPAAPPAVAQAAPAVPPPAQPRRPVRSRTPILDTVNAALSGGSGDDTFAMDVPVPAPRPAAGPELAGEAGESPASASRLEGFLSNPLTIAGLHLLASRNPSFAGAVGEAGLGVLENTIQQNNQRRAVQREERADRREARNEARQITQMERQAERDQVSDARWDAERADRAAERAAEAAYRAARLGQMQQAIDIRNRNLDRLIASGKSKGGMSPVDKKLRDKIAEGMADARMDGDTEEEARLAAMWVQIMSGSAMPGGFVGDGEL